MLKASSSGIVLTRLALTTGKVGAKQCLFRIQLRSSSFSARFAARIATLAVTSSDLDPDPVPVLRGVQERQRVQSHTPLARAAPWLGTATVNGSRREEAERKPKLSGGHKANALQARHHVESTRTRHRHVQARRVKNAVNVPSKEGETVRGEQDTKRRGCFESSKLNDSTQTQHNKLQEQGRVFKSLEDILGGGRQIQDLSVHELRAIIFNKKSILMLDAWDAYQRLVSLEVDEDIFRDHPDGGVTGSYITVGLLATLANRLVAERKIHRKNSRETFLRLLSVYARLRRKRARVEGVPYLRTPEWNSLIHCAGTGLRGKLSLEAYNAALDIYDDMLRGVDESKAASYDSLLRDIEPDIYTYTTLLNIALRSEHQPAIDHAMTLLKDSNKEPTRVTHLCTMRYHYMLEGLAGARAVLAALSPDEIGADGITAYMVCAGTEGDLNVVENLYNALRQNIEVRDDGTCGTIHDDQGSSNSSGSNGIDKYVSVEGIRFPRTLVPSEAVYNYVIQIFVYYGRLSEALQVFTEMLATRRSPPDEGFFQPSFPVFRALFLGFARHSHHIERRRVLTRKLIERQSDWTWERLSILLDAFLDMGDTMSPSERMVYWIMESVRRLTGDEQLLRQVWKRLNARWRIRKGGRLKVLDIKYGRSVDDGEHGSNINV